jgi:hypothetical protein
MIPVAHSSLITAKNQIPLSRVTLYDTTKTVPSKGFNVYFYNLPDSDTSTVETLLQGASPWYDDSDVSLVFGGTDIVEYSSALMFDWGVGGAPPPISRSHLYGVRWVGYFYARYSGAYRFYMDKCAFGRIRLKFDGSYLSFYDPDAVSINPWTSTTIKECYADTSSLTAGTWYAIQIEFAIGRQEELTTPTYLCVKYKEPTGATTALSLWDTTGDVTDYAADTHKKVLSAGVVNTTAAFLTGTVITGITKLPAGGKGQDESGQYQFTVGLGLSTWLTTASEITDTTLTVKDTGGFPDKGVILLGTSTEVTYTGKTSTTFTGCIGIAAHDANTRVTLMSGDYSYNPMSKDFGIIKEYRLVKIEYGHRDPATDIDYYSEVIWGHVYPNPSVSRSENEDLLTVYIQDFNNLLIDMQRNYPDQASYSGASYYSKSTTGEPDGRDRPVAYDWWNCEDAVRDLYIRANIDPVLTYQRKKLNTAGTFATDYGGYLIDADFQLNGQPNYGNSTSADNADDEYLWFFGYGTQLKEVISGFAETFGRTVGFNANGYALFSSNGLPFAKVDVKDAVATGTWTDVNDFDCYKGHYKHSSTLNDNVVFSANGSEFVLLVGRYDNFGTVEIKVDGNVVTQIYIDGEFVSAGDGVYDLSYTDRTNANPYFWYEGVDSTGNNPSEIRIVTQYDYGAHTITVTVKTGTPMIDGLLCYDISSEYPIREIDTARVVESFTSVFDLENNRNEAIVVGKLKGLFQDSEGKTINPNNPISLHLYSRAVDNYSIYDTSKVNYVGRRLAFEIYDPKINAQEWADYVSTNNVMKYRTPVFQPDFTIDMDYRLEPGDCITMADLKTKTTTEDDLLWIEHVEHGMDFDGDGKIRATTSIQTTPRKPVKSYERRAPLDLSDYNDEPIINIEIRSQGKRISGNDVASVNTTTKRVTLTNDPGWTDDMWIGYTFILMPITATGDENIIIRDSIADNGSNWIEFESVDLTAAWVSTYLAYDLMWSIAFDPMDAYQKGVALEINYDQLISGVVKIFIKDAEGRHVAMVNPATENEIVEWGSDKTVYWSGVYEKNEETNYFINNEDVSTTGNLKRPLSVVFIVYDTDGNQSYIITSKVKGKHYAGMITGSGNQYTEMVNSEPMAIFPFIHDAPPIYYLDDEDGAQILNSGRIANWTNGTATVDCDNTANSGSVTGKYMLIAIEDMYSVFRIESASVVGSVLRCNLGVMMYDGDITYTSGILLGSAKTLKYKHYIIFDGLPFNTFQTTDNTNNGLKLHLAQADFYVEDFNGVYVSSGSVKVTQTFSIFYNDTEYEFVADTALDVCMFSDKEYDQYGDPDTDYALIFWDANNPTKLYWTWCAADEEWGKSLLSKAMNPRLGLFPIGIGTRASFTADDNLILLPTKNSLEIGLYCSINKELYSIYGTVSAWEAQENWFEANNYPVASDIDAIYYNPEADGNAFIDLPVDTDKDTQYLAQLFVFRTDFRDRAGRMPCNQCIFKPPETSTGYKPHAKMIGTVMTESGQELLPIRTDTLAVFWEPLTSVGTETYVVKADDCQLLDNFGWRDIVVTAYDT